MYPLQDMMQNQESNESFPTESVEQEGFMPRLRQNGLSVLIMLLNIVQVVVSVFVFLGQRISDEVVATEHMFLLMTNLYAFMCQFFFFTLCDLTLLRPEEEEKPKRGKVISGLTTLLLYSIITYFASKIRDAFTHVIDRYTLPSTTRAFAIRIIKINLEVIKAAIVILCLREQGLQYHFDAKYSAATFIYYICTEKLFVDAIIWIAQYCAFRMFDGLEHLYIPIILHSVSLALTVLILFFLMTLGKHFVYAVLSSYFTLYLPLKNLMWNYVTPLIVEQQTFASFKVANEKELNQWDDICAVCLDRMSTARVTPCKHLFHPHCLKRCLQTSMKCPLCKCDFISATARNRQWNTRWYFRHRR